MKKLFLLLVFVFVVITAFSQTVFKYRISFKNKNNSIYSISNPSAFLTQKALTRRTNQGIQIDMLDIPVNQWYIDSVVNLGASCINRSRWFNSIIIGLTDTTILPQIKALAFVKSIQLVIALNKKKQPEKKSSKAQNILFNAHKNVNPFTTNTELKLEDNWSSGSKNINYGQSFTQINMLKGDFLHSQGFQGQGMTIAVLDGGFSQVDTMNAFDSLWLNGQILGYRDFVSPGNNIFNESTHGMMVLSTMAANIPGQIVGTAPKANYWLLRTENTNTENLIEEDNWASGAEFADSIGADLINSSLGYTTFDDPTMNHTYQDLNGKTARASIAATIAARKGILVVNSAGNSGDGAWKYIGVPADADSIISVGAVNAAMAYASFSSTGPTSDARIKPTVAAMGQGSTFAVVGGIGSGNGTSFASPILCGAACCLWQAFPQKTNQEIIEAIKQSANQYNSPDSLLGYGIPNFQAACILLSGNKIPNIDNENNFNAFPNPFDDDIYISYNSSDTQQVKIQLFDLTGKLLLSAEDVSRNYGYNSIHIKNTSALNTGIYFIRITSGNITSTKKVLKK
ncbi:MAG: S8 family serine peptidase [Bacteroidetes bacterium]|nr:S8 family serine peptidase [Bacteroidota bacterium]